VPQEKMWLNYNTAVCHFICIAFKVYNFDHVKRNLSSHMHKRLTIKIRL